VFCFGVRMGCMMRFLGHRHIEASASSGEGDVSFRSLEAYNVGLSVLSRGMGKHLGLGVSVAVSSGVREAGQSDVGSFHASG
jgi:hypothetical protein